MERPNQRFTCQRSEQPCWPAGCQSGMGKQQGPVVWLQVRARSSCSIFKKTSRVAFILGGTLNVSLQKEVEDEAAQFGDIVQVSFCMEMWKWEQITANNHQADFIDSYRNMSYKNLLGLAWLSSWCPQAGYFFTHKSLNWNPNIYSTFLTFTLKGFEVCIMKKGGSLKTTSKQ